MSRATIQPTGMIVYRTKLLTHTDAGRFAKCLSANSRFCDVETVVSEQAKGDKCEFITFRPANEERQRDMYQDQWNTRKLRAIDEGAEYVIVKDEDRNGAYWIFNPKSGETYQAGLYGCSCADYSFRCRKAGLHCKHLHALQMQADRGMIISMEPAVKAA